MRKIRYVAMIICLIFTIVSAAYADMNGPYRDGFIEGYLKAKYDNQVLIEEYDGTLHVLPLASNIAIQIDGVLVTLSDVKIGMEVYGEIEGKRLTLLESYSTENPGYIPPGGKVRTGIVKKIDRDQIIIKNLFGKEEIYFTSPITIALKKGVNIPLSTLYEGDRVKLYFDEIDSDYISRMHIEGDSILIKDLYRGKLAVADSLEDVIVLENVEAFKNTKWQSVKDSIRIPYSTDLPLYIGGQKLTYKNLKYFKGKTIYMAVKDFFGKDKIEKMIIKNQYEAAYTDRIKDVNWYTQAIELGNNKNLAFHDGTIIIKNGRLVDIYGINDQSDAFVVADGSGTQATADVIYLYNEDINNSTIGQNAIYAGRLDTILQNQVTLKNFFALDKNEWQSFSDTKEFFYDNDTSIFDVEENKTILTKEFYANDYAVDEDSDYADDNNLKDWYGYIYADGDRIASIVVQKNMDSLLPQRITNGIIESVTEDNLVGWELNLQNASDWSSIKDKWMPKNTSLSINLGKAMIIKDGKRIEPYDLKTGDRLYIVRDDYIGKVVIVK
ncbi:MAG: hypothetical protein ACOYVK_16935 [Bacillota bacterium]